MISAVIAEGAYRRGSLSESGRIGALIVGILIFGFGGWIWGVLLGIFFISSSMLSHFKEAEKQLAAEKFEKGHRRDFSQAMANGGLGGLIALLSAAGPSDAWLPLYIGVMATVTADTWATELGTLAKNPPRLITSGRPVEVGSSGGVSLLGTSVSLMGGLIIGLAAGLLSPELSLQVALIAGGAGGLVGSLFDSFLGATVQQIYYCDTCTKETERKVHRCGTVTRSLRGWSWLNNDLVNLFASIIGGLTTYAVWLLLK